MTNAEIADAFDRLADLLEFQGANPFRIRAYRSAARSLHTLAAGTCSRSAAVSRGAFHCK